MKNAPLLPLLLTEQQVAELLNVSTRTVRKLAAAGKLRRVPIGRKRMAPGNLGGNHPVRYNRAQVLKLAETGWVW